MKRFGAGAVLAVCVMASGCAKDNLDSLHLVSAEEISVQKRQAAPAAESAKTAAAAPSTAASAVEKPAEVPAPAPTPAAQ